MDAGRDRGCDQVRVCVGAGDAMFEPQVVFVRLRDANRNDAPTLAMASASGEFVLSDS
jgi:hypothetical protein